MADMMQFDLVSPERMLASLEASEVEIPGAEGDFTAMPDHAALITTMRPGVLKAKSGGQTTEFVVTGGFVEVSGSGVSVLAEHAVPRTEISRDEVEVMISEAETAANEVTPDLKDAADKRIADTRGLLEQLGL